MKLKLHNSKKRVKKAACCILAVGMAVMSVVPANMIMNINTCMEVQAAESLTYTVGNSTYTYAIKDDNTVEITDYSGTDTEIEIPGEIEGKKVTSIGDSVFSVCSSLKSINIPESVISIGDGVFENCSNLESIKLPQYMEKIGGRSFYNCKSLRSIKIPEGITGISSDMISNSKGVFGNCSSLEMIELPSSLTSIGNYAFRNCTNLKQVQIPNSVTKIGEKAFSSCVNINIEKLPSNLISIGWCAFENCRNLISIEIPSKVQSIGVDKYGYKGSAFIGCSSLKSIKVADDNQSFTAVNDILFSKDMTELIVYPAAKEGDTYVIPNTVTKIRSCAFGYGNYLTNIVIPTGVTEIDSATFESCCKLENVVLSQGITTIWQNAFDSCSKLTSINIPDSVTSIEYEAFEGCNSLKNVLIPASVSKIGRNAFGYYTYYAGQGKFDKAKYDDFTLSGYTGTATETYAQENGFKFIELKSAESSEGVQIEYPKEDIAEGGNISLVTDKLSQEDKGYQNIEVNIKDKIVSEGIKPENVKFTAFDITLKDDKGENVQPSGKVTVKIPVPEGYTGEKCKVYYVNEKSEFVDMAAVYVGGYMIFETDHFSTYMVTETELESVEDVTVIFADANSDGTVNSKDVVMMKKHLAGIKVDINLAACDVNADGRFDSKDVVKTMKKLAGYDVVLGEK